MKLPRDIHAFVQRCFPPEQWDDVLSLLERACIEDGSAASPRLLRCAVFASHGRLPQLRKLVALLAIDWRDVVVAGEYESRGKELVHARDLEQPFPD